MVRHSNVVSERTATAQYQHMMRCATHVLTAIDRKYSTNLASAQTADTRIRAFLLFSIAHALNIPVLRLVAEIRGHYAFRTNAGLGLSIAQLTNSRVVSVVVQNLLKSGTLEARLSTPVDFADTLVSGQSADVAHHQYQQSVQAAMQARTDLYNQISMAVEKWANA